MASLIYQLLIIRPDMLRMASQKFETAMESKKWLDEDETTALTGMSSCLMGVLRSFPSDQSVTLVLDRMDKCCFGMSDLSSRELLMQLRQALKQALIKLKFKVVAAMKDPRTAAAPTQG